MFTVDFCRKGGYNLQKTTKGVLALEQVPPYYLIRLDPPPQRLDAPQNRKEGYHRQYQPADVPRMEITFLQEGSVSEKRGGKEITYGEGTVYTQLLNRSFEQYSRAPVVQEFFMAFNLAEAPRPLYEEEVANWTNTVHCAILPEYITDHAACERIGNLLKTANKLIIYKDMIRSLKLRTIMYECFSILTEQAVLQAQERLKRISRLQSPYTKKAKIYLDFNLHRRVQVAEVADYVGISYDHLNRVFRQDLNMTMLEYLNRAKVRRVEQYITVDGMSMEAAGEQVGIQDTKYLSRLFHRYTGVSAAEYRRIYRERQEV